MARLIIAANRGGTNGTSGVTILNGTSVTGYSLIDAINWDNYAPDIVYATRKDGVATATDYTLSPRMPSFPIRVIGSTWAAAQTLLQTLGKEVLACQRSGGKLTYQATPASIPVYLTVRGAKFETSLVSNRGEIHFRFDGMLSLVCDPAAVGDVMGFRDDFAIDSSANYTQDAGAFTISAGSLGYASTGAKRFRHTAYNYNYTNVQVTTKITTGSTVASADWAVMARCQGTADTALLGRIVGSATNQIQFAKVVAGVVTTLATAAFVPATSTNYWLRLRLEGSRGTAEVFTSEPKPLDAATASATATLSAADQQAFVSGPVGFRTSVVSTAERFDDFDVRPNTFRFSSPDVLRLTGIPGDLPALITSEVTVPSSLATQAVFGGVYWAERQRQVNLCWNGNLEETAGGNTQGWFNTTVAGVITAAGGAVARDATASKFGSACIAFTTTAVANQGLNFPMARRARFGQTYIALGWMQSAAGVGNVDMQLGLSGDIAASTVQALSTAWKFFSAAWTPTADRDLWYLSPRHVAATAETVRFDGGGVFEATPQTLSAAITTTGQTTMTLTAAPPEGAPAVPYVAIIEPGTANQELVRVTAVNSDGITVTAMDRGWDGTTAATHALGSAVYALPGYWFDATSDGVHGSMLDITGAANPYAVSADFTNMSVDASSRAGVRALTGATATTSTLSIFVDPSTLVPPEFTNDELLVEVWGRMSTGANPPAPKVATYTRGQEGATAPARYDLENGSSGLALTAPTGAVRRFVRLGVVPIRYSDAQQRRRVQIGLSYTITSSGTAMSWDYIMLVPAGQRATTPTGRANDSNYPQFLPSTSLQQTRRFTSDLVSEVGTARETMAFGNLNPQGGIICPTGVTFAAPNADVAVKLSTLVPNNPSGAADSDDALNLASEATVTATFNVQPRFLTLR